MSHFVYPVQTSLVAPAPARPVTPDLLDEWAVVDEHNLAVAVPKLAAAKKVEHKATQVVKLAQAISVEGAMVQIGVKAEFAG